MPASDSEASPDRLALRIALSFAAALTAAEAADLQLTFIAPLVAASLAATPGLSAAALLLLPPLAWGLATAVAILVEAFAGDAPLVFLLTTLGGLWAGFALSERPRLAAIGLLALVFFAIAPMRLLAHPNLADVVVNDIGRNVLVGAAVVAVVGLALPAPPAASARPLFAPAPPLLAASALTLAAYLVWVLEPPAPAAVLVGVILTLKADGGPPLFVGRDRALAAAVGGAAAVVAATLVALAPTLPMLLLALLALAWPLARGVSEGGAWRGAAMKALNALAILTAEGFSPLFEDTEERLWIRIAGVAIGLLGASAALALIAPSAARRVGPA